MKKLNAIFVGLSMVLALASCRKDNNYPEMSNAFQNGSWRITEFYHVDHDETHPYINYKITFTTLETITATGQNFYRGNWHITDDGDLQLDFGKTYQFDRFNATWHIVNYNDQVIEMNIVNGTDHLVFQKIQ